jgi:YhcH/YjgK/YiaL family protein
VPLIEQEPSTPYNSENDVTLYSLPEEEINYLTLQAGQFIIFFPSDIHQPETFHHQPELVKKVVLKVKVQGSTLNYD